MGIRKTLTFLILASGLIVAPFAGAQQKNVGPSSAGSRPNAVRPYVACAALMGGSAVAAVSDHRAAVGTRQKAARRSALQSAALKDGATTATAAKPFTHEQVASMVRDGFGDESGAKLIEQRGIDFTPSEGFIQSLKAAGASEAFLNALRAAVAPGLSPAGNVAPTFRSAHSAHADLKVSATTAAPEPAGPKKPLNQVQVFALLAGQVPGHRVSMLVQERGIDFEPTDDYLQEVRLAGGEDELVSALKSAKVTKPATVDPAAQARQVEVLKHVARGGELEEKEQFAQAEQEYHAALLFDPQNADLYLDLAYVLDQQKRWDDAAAADREAVRLNPDDDQAHFNLGVEFARKDESDDAIVEYREALRLNPNNENAHINMAAELASKGDWDGMITECREVLRLNPNNSSAHFDLGLALEQTGDLHGALVERRAAYMLDPKNPSYKAEYEGLLLRMNK